MAPVQNFEALVSRILEAEDPYDEIPKVIAHLRDENRRLGGHDRVLAALIVMKAALIELPVTPVEGAVSQ